MQNRQLLYGKILPVKQYFSHISHFTKSQNPLFKFKNNFSKMTRKTSVFQKWASR
jgi:hypothetical protein